MTEERLEVLWHPGPGESTSPFVVKQAAALEKAEVKVEALSLSRLVKGHTVVHIHWPEHLVRSRSGIDRFRKPPFVLAVLALLRFRRSISVIWTVHNLAPHAPPNNRVERRLESELLRLLATRSDAIVTLVAANEGLIRETFDVPESTKVVHIPEGIGFDPAALKTSASDDDPVELLAIGSLLRYKGLRKLAQLCSALPSREVRLRIVGEAADELLLQELLTISEGADGSVEVLPRRVSNDELAHIASTSHAAVVTHDAQFNSGTPYWAFGQYLPVISVESPVISELSDNLGKEWIFTLPLDYQEDDFALAIEWVRAPRADMSAGLYDWPLVTAKLVDLYRNVRKSS